MRRFLMLLGVLGFEFSDTRHQRCVKVEGVDCYRFVIRCEVTKLGLRTDWKVITHPWFYYIIAVYI